MSKSKNAPKRDAFTVYDPERENAHNFEARSDADERMDKAAELDIDAELYPPGDLPDDAEPTTDGGTVEPETADTVIEGAEPVDAEVIDHTADGEDDHEPEYRDLPDRTISDDPLTWMPGEYVDTIDGSEAINRKGFEVLAHFYAVDVETEVVVQPEDTDHEYCRAEAVATTPDGREVNAHGSAHIDRGDDHFLLLEMADTRARKRALSIATGVGAVAVEELRNEVDQ